MIPRHMIVPDQNAEKKLWTPPFVPLEEEAEYLDKHHLGITTLDNGIKMYNMSRVVGDKAEATIDIRFPTGAYNDPYGQAGSHHLLEHLVVDYTLRDTEAHIHGSTSPWDTRYQLGGVANPDVTEYGVWPVIAGYKEMLAAPLEHHDDIDAAVAREKRIILRERDERAERQKFVEFKSDILYDDKNPIRADIPGTPESLGSITRDDMFQLGEQVNIPDGAVVTIYSEGRPDTSARLRDRLLEGFVEFPRVGKKSRQVDRELVRRLNPDLEVGHPYIFESRNNEPTRYIDLAWILTGSRPLVQDLALQRLTPLFAQTVSEYVRDEGLSYGGDFQVQNIDHELKLCFASFALANRSDIGEFVADRLVGQIQRHWGRIPDQTFNALNANEQLKQAAIPLSAHDRFGIFLDGMFNHNGRIIDADQVKQLFTQIQPDMMKDWRTQIIDNRPVVFIY